MGKRISAAAIVVAAIGLSLALSALSQGASAATSGRGVSPLIAVIDTGADLAHPALAGALWSNPGEQANGQDDDGNGIVDDLHGRDFVDGDGNPTDEHGHGTHTAGVIAGSGVPVMVLRALDASASGSESAVADAIAYAVEHGATVVNLSLNTDAQDPDLEAAIGAAADRGVTIVASAGNDGRNLDARPSFPICSGHDNVIGVAATDASGQAADFSATGSCVDRSAPGVDVAGPAIGGGTQSLTGTSQAAAQVTAELARR